MNINKVLLQEQAARLQDFHGKNTHKCMYIQLFHASNKCITLNRTNFL